MKSESTRLLRQWWDEPGDYLWMVEFYRRRGLMGALRASNVFGGVVTILALAFLLFEQLVQPPWLSHAAVIGMLVGSIGWIVFWGFSRGLRLGKPPCCSPSPTSVSPSRQVCTPSRWRR